MSEQTQEGFRYSDGSVPQDRPETAQSDTETRHAEPDVPDDWTHYVHLADGTVVKHKMTDPLASHLPEEEDTDLHGGRFITGIYPR